MKKATISRSSEGKMKNYSDSLVVIVTDWAVRQARDLGVYYSEMSACWVASVNCDGCGVKYEEQLGAVETKLRKSLPLLCIGCDDEAAE